MDEIITQKIKQAFEPDSFELINESEKHRGHAGYDGTGESHYRLIMTSKKFNALSRLERQRLVHSVLADELKSRIHALSLSLSPSES